MVSDLVSQNFAFMRAYGTHFDRLGALAEQYFTDDPNTCLIKLRQLAELLAQEVAARTGLYTTADEPQSELLRRLRVERAVPSQVLELFHQIRIAGNQATHAHNEDHSLALTTLKISRELAVWFHRGFGKEPDFRPGAFTPPARPVDATATLQLELDRLKSELAETLSDADRARADAAEARRAHEFAKERADRIAEERATWEVLALEAEHARNAMAGELEARQAAAEAAPPPMKAELAMFVERAANAINLDEASTRVIIDRQLRERGWEVDTEKLRYASGTRPAKGRAMAIAEWPTDSGPADYALFVDTKLVGVVEAKRRNKNISASIDQAERYAKGFRFASGTDAAGGPWGEYKAPFVFSTNARP